MKPTLAMLVLAASPALGADGNSAADVVTALYDPDTVVSIDAQVGMALDIELGTGEHVSGVAGGDLSSMDLGVERHHVVVRPRQVVAPTNLVIFTDRRTYRFVYHADPMRPTRPLVAVRFVYPDAVQAPPDPVVRHTDYWFCGPDSLRPAAAYDDGTRTYLRFDPDHDLPVLYRRTPDGREQLLNSHVDGSWIVVHEVAPTLVVRRAHEVGCIQRRPSERVADAGPGSLP